jgi:hypothetical protein
MVQYNLKSHIIVLKKHHAHNFYLTYNLDSNKVQIFYLKYLQYGKYLMRCKEK